jgi:hypothetical protein
MVVVVNGKRKLSIRREEVYMITDAHEFCGEYEHLQSFKENTNYYQTYGGGDEGGYFVKNDLVYEVNRSWGTSFTFNLLVNKKLTYTQEDRKNGICASVLVM